MILAGNPPGWGQDEISKFIDIARGNEFATFANIKGEITRLIDIDLSYRKSIQGINHSNDWFTGFFLIRAHSNFLATCRLCWSGQLPECYALLRSCLENALYGLYLARNQASQDTWLRRSESPEAKKKVKKEFQIQSLLDFANTVVGTESQIAKTLYDCTIDFGAHPNELALMQTLKMNKKSEKEVEYKISYLEENSDQLRLAIKTTAQVGVCALSLFRSVYPERFDILGVSEALRHIKKGL